MRATVPLRGAFIPGLDSAVAGTFLGALDPISLETLMRDAVLVESAPGTQFPIGAAQRVGVLVSGELRIFVQSPTGRQLTLRYVRAPGTFGVAGLVSRDQEIAAQALTPIRVLRLDGRVVREVAMRDPRLAMAVAHEAGARLDDAVRELASYAFGSVKQRLARHLLDLATESSLGGLVVRASQQELADAVGSVREVVGKLLLQMRADALVAAAPSGIRLLDLPRLQTLCERHPSSSHRGS